VPFGLFGLPIAQAALPTFSEYAAKDKYKQLKESILTSLHQILFLILPTSAFMIVMKIPVVRLVYGADKFQWNATVETAMTLAVFATSLAFQAMVHLFSRAFFALHDSKTPVIISVISIVANTVMSILFVFVFQYPLWSLALSASVSTAFQAGLLLIFLDKKVHRFDRRELFIPAVKITLATICMAISVYVPKELLDILVFDTTRTINLIVMTWTIGCIGLATYIFFAWFFNIEEVLTFIKFGQKLIRVKDILFDTSQEVGIEKR